MQLVDRYSASTCTLSYLRTCSSTCARVAHLCTCAHLHPCELAQVLVNMRICTLGYFRTWRTRTCPCTCALVYLCTFLLAHLRTCASTWALTHLHMYLRTCVIAHKYLCKYLHTCILAHLLTCVFAKVLAQALVHLRSLAHTRALAQVLAHLRTCALVYLNTCANTSASTYALALLRTALAQELNHLRACASTCTPNIKTTFGRRFRLIELQLLF